LRPARPDAEREPALAQEVDRGALLGEQDRVAEVDTGHVRPDEDARRRAGGRHQRRDGAELATEVIVHLEALVAEGLHPPDQSGPLLGRAGLGGLRSEPERTSRHVTPPWYVPPGSRFRPVDRPAQDLDELGHLPRTALDLRVPGTVVRRGVHVPVAPAVAE